MPLQRLLECNQDLSTRNFDLGEDTNVTLLVFRVNVEDFVAIVVVLFHYLEISVVCSYNFKSTAFYVGFMVLIVKSPFL